MGKSNRGATLIELLVGIAVVAVVGGLIGSFLIFSTRTYGQVAEEADMQEDAQILLAQMNNYLIDTDASLRYFVDTSEGGVGTEVLSDSLHAGGGLGLKEKRLEIYKKQDGGLTREIITWRESEGSLTYRKEQIDGAGNIVSEILEQELAGNVADFSADLTEVASLRQVRLSVRLEREGRSYHADAVVYLRNQVAVNRAPDAVIEETPAVPSILSVKVMPQTVTVRPGSRKSFIAVVYGSNFPSQEVTWSLEGNLSALTVLNSDTGVLWVATDEKAETLTVRATSVQDPSKSAAAQVTVLQNKKLSLGGIRYYWLYQDAEMYLYARVNGVLSGELTWEVRQVREGSDPVWYPDNLRTTGDALKAMNACCFRGWYDGEYAVTVKGVVDGENYEDTVYIDVIFRGEYNVAGNGTYVTFGQENRLHYWLQPGESLELSTTLLNDELGTYRTYSIEEKGGLTPDSYTWGSYGTDNANLWIKIDPGAQPGELYVKATVSNQYATNYDKVIIHVAYPLAHPYVVEAVNIDSGGTNQNFFWERNNFWGPVKLADSTSELTDLGAGIESLVARDGGFDREITSGGWRLGAWELDGRTHLNLSGDGAISSSSGIKLGGIIVSEGNVDLSCGKPIQTNGDTIIYIKGDHTLKIRFDECYFDGIIYAPEGKVEISADRGCFRGVVIARELDLVERGECMINFMEKESVMDMVNLLKR